MWYTAKPVMILTALMLCIAPLRAQDCGCSNCNIPIVADYERTFSLEVDGVTANVMGQNNFVCGVVVDFAHDFISDLKMDLISPSGASITLVASNAWADTTYGTRWKIRFVPCWWTNIIPDPGQSPYFGDNNNWPAFTQLSGTYYPYEAGCFDGLNDGGSVNGKWQLRVSSYGYRGTGFIYGFDLEFCNEGPTMNCFGLNYDMAAGENCNNASPLPANITEFIGNTANYWPDQPPPNYCGSVENDQWYAFIAKCNVTYFQLTPGYCINNDGLQLAVYDDCNSQPLDCNGGCESCGWQSISMTFQTTPGEKYYIQIDGWAGDQCDFIFSVPPSCIGDLGNPDPPPYTPSGCAGSVISLALNEIVFGASGYIWSATNGALVNGQVRDTVYGPENLWVDLTLGNDDGLICVQAFNFTSVSPTVCFPFFADSTKYLEEYATVCSYDLPFFSAYEAYGVPPIYQAGTYQILLQDYVDEFGNLHPCDVWLTVHLSVEGSSQTLPPVVALGDSYQLPNGQTVTSSGLYEWSQSLPSGCENQFQQIVYLIGVQTTSDGCAPDTVTFNMPGGGVILQCPGANPPVVTGFGIKKVVYQTEGTYDLTAKLGPNNFVFDDALSFEFADNASPQFSFATDQNAAIFVNNSTNATGYLWEFGDGSTSTETNPVHTYNAPGTYLVTLHAQGPCGAVTLSQTVTIGGQLPTAAFAGDQLEGCAPLSVQFVDLSAGDPQSWSWQFPGGTPAFSTSQHPEVVYDTPGTWPVSLTIQNLFGQDSTVQTGYVTVWGPTSAGFSLSVQGNVVQVQDNSLNANQLLWDFGDGTTSTEPNPLHEYNTPGDYTVTFIAIGACNSDTTLQSVHIDAAPVAAFSAAPAIGCVPLVVQYTDQSSGNPDAWSWSFPGGMPASSTDQNPVVIYLSPGIFDATLNVSNATGQHTLVQTTLVEVAPLPTVAFDVTQNGAEFVFQNQSGGALSYLWEFGDDSTSTEANPTHTYTNEGQFLITLHAINACGESILQQWVTVILGAANEPWEGLNIRLMPNPSNGIFKVVLDGQPDPRFRLQLFDAIGRSVWSRDPGAFTGNWNETIDVRQHAAGIYWLDVEISGRHHTLKVDIHPE